MRTRTPQRRRWLPAVLAGALAAAVGLACGAVVFGGDQQPRTPTTESSPPGPPAGTTPPPASDLAPAPSPRPDTTGHATEPAAGDLRFIDVAGVRLAVSETAGPHDIGGGLARGFAQTRAGAALAAAHILVRIHPEAGADVFGPTLAHQVVGEHREALAANIADTYEQLLHQWPATYGQPAGQLYLALPGYRIDSFTDEAAVVALLIEVPDPGGGTLLGATTMSMRWHDGDWALLAPAGGTFTDTSLVDDTSGFTFWGR